MSFVIESKAIIYKIRNLSKHRHFRNGLLDKWTGKLETPYKLRYDSILSCHICITYMWIKCIYVCVSVKKKKLWSNSFGIEMDMSMFWEEKIWYYVNNDKYEIWILLSFHLYFEKLRWMNGGMMMHDERVDTQNGQLNETTNGHESNDNRCSQCLVCVWFYFMRVVVVVVWFSAFIFINHGISFDNSSSSSSSVPDDSPDDRNGVDFNWSLVGTIPRHLPHAPLFKSPDKIYILPQRTHSSCGSPANHKREEEKKHTEFCR